MAATALADPQGLPKLPTANYDYDDYAVTSPPIHIQNLLNSATNNTPVDNPITNAGATLGRVLFYDTRLSGNGHGGTACASCHHQANGFSDPNQFSIGETGDTGRHAPGLSEATFYQRGHFFWDERADALEDQVLMPIESVVEMNSTLGDASTPGTVVYELSQTPFYQELFQAAFGDPTVTAEGMSKAMAQFVRSMVSYNSKYDTAFFNFVNGEPTTPSAFPNFPAALDDPAAPEPSELRGEVLFHNSTGKCSSCHAPPAQVATNIFNIGLDANSVPDPETNPVDPGVGGITGQAADMGNFKVPSLRNVAVRGRYMHDGRFSTLEEVVEFYSSGVHSENPNLSAPLTGPLNLTDQEIADLVAYLNTLTDQEFLTNSIFSDPFAQLPGDFDFDGDVDPDDVNLLASMATTGTSAVLDLLTFDLNGDGVVDFHANGSGMASDSDYLIRTILGTEYGDANLDGVVDIADLDLLGQGFDGDGNGWLFGDFDGSGGMTEIGDLDLLGQWWHFGVVEGAALAAAAIPEPCTYTLAAFTLLILAFGRRRRRDRIP